MDILLPFLLSFFFSFIGSIPPASINLTVVQLGLEKKINVALGLALGASLIEYPYAWIAVKFESMITASPVVVSNFELIAAIVMITLGILNLWSTRKPSTLIQKFNDSGFKRGLVLGVLNPLSMPFWIGVTAYLESQHWLTLSTAWQIHSYLLGVVTGAVCLLVLLAYLSKRIALGFQDSKIIKLIPGIVMIVMGLYSFGRYLFFTH